MSAPNPQTGVGVSPVADVTQNTVNEEEEGYSLRVSQL